MYHGVEGFEVESICTFHLGNVVGLGYRPVPFPFIGSYFRLPTDIVDEDISQRPCRKILYPHGIHPLDLALLGKLYRRDRFLFLAL